MKKFLTLDEYLAKHEFLRETANVNLQLERKFADVEPLDLPPRDEVLSIVNADKIPLIQRDEFSTKVLDAVERLTEIPRELAEKFLRQEPSDEVLMRKTFWAAVDKLWHWRRVGCPYCGNDDMERIHIIEVDGKRTIRPDVCDECHAYLKTYGEDDEPNIYLRDWTTLHLDLFADFSTPFKGQYQSHTDDLEPYQDERTHRRGRTFPPGLHQISMHALRQTRLHVGLPRRCHLAEGQRRGCH